MKNKLAQVIRRILPDTTDRQDGPESFEIRFDADGVKLYLEKVEFERFLSGGGAPNINLQGVVLRMLEEQGLASRFPNGFSLDASVIASLDNEQAELLGLPPRFSGEFKVSIDGHSNSKAFSVKIFPELGGSKAPCRIKGALMEVGSGHRYLLDQPQMQAFQALDRHSLLPENLKTRSEERRVGNGLRFTMW